MVEDPSFWKEFANYGVAGILAAAMFWFYQKREKEHKEFTIDCLQERAEMNNQLVTVVKDNTSAMTKNTTVIDALHRRLDGEERHFRLEDRENH